MDHFLSSLKPVTKFVLLGIVLEAAAVSVGLVDPRHFILHFPVEKRQAWKYLTTLLYNGKFNMGLLFELIFL